MNSKIRVHVTEVLNTLRTLFRSVPLLWRAASVETAFLGVILLIQGLVPAFGIWLTKIIVDLVVGVTEGNAVGIPILGLIALWGMTLLVESAAGPLVFMLVGNLNEKLTAHINLLLMQKACSLPDLHTFENATFYNDLQLLQKQVSSRPVNLIIILVAIGRQLVTLGAVLFLLGTLDWWIPLIILLLAIPQAQIILHLQEATWNALLKRTPESRRMSYFSMLTLTDTYAKEVRLFNLGPYLMSQFRSAFTSLHTSMRQVRVKKAIWTYPVILLSIGGNIFAFWWVITNALAGRLSPGDVLLFVQALIQAQRSLLDILENFGFLYERILFFDKLFQFLAYQSPIPLKLTPLPMPKLTHSTICFNNVTFCYPDGTLALGNVTFEMRAGEKIALVGENGAGKSTIVKLLARFYDPTEGSILIDGIDLRDLDLIKWRQQLGAVFQDFSKYSLTVRENINLSNIAEIDNQHLMRVAAEHAGFDQVADRLSEKYETLLGKQFGGAELSGGQWQKLAVARAFARDAELLILDEPTASLDPRSEYELFLRFARLTDGKTTLFVTHRLGSIKMVDRIFVLKEGKLLETGSHSQLLNLGGEYASLYKMQAGLYDQNN